MDTGVLGVPSHRSKLQSQSRRANDESESRCLFVPAIIVSSHAAHARGDLVSFLKSTIRTILDDAHSLDAEDAWELDAGAVSLSSIHLGPIQPKCLDSDEDLVWAWNGDGDVFHLEDLRPARFTDHHSSHRVVTRHLLL